GPVHQYRNNRASSQKLDEQRVYGERATRCGSASFLVVPERLLRETSQLDPAAAHEFSAGELSRHECQRLWWRYADYRRLAARRWNGCGTRRAAAEAGFPPRIHARSRACRDCCTLHENYLSQPR